MHNLKRGFKDPQCSKKNCLGRSVDAPALSPSIIKNLGATFCKLDEKDLSDSALLKKKMLPTLASGNKRTSKKKASSDANEAEALPTPSGKKATKKKSTPNDKDADVPMKDQKKPRK